MSQTLTDRDVFKHRLVERISRSYFVRFHMLMIVSATVMSGVICSKILLVLGITRMPVRYGMAVTLSYLLFFLFTKLWLLYIGVGRESRTEGDGGGSDLWLPEAMTGPLDILSSSADSGPLTAFGGGASGGGGAGGRFGDGDSSSRAVQRMTSDTGASGGAGEDNAGDGLHGVLDIGEEIGLRLLAIILLAALVCSAFLVGAYLIWIAPTLLAEVAFQVLLATSLAGKVGRAEAIGWETTIFRATWWMFLLILGFAIAFGIVVQHVSPDSVTVRDFLARAR